MCIRFLMLGLGTSLLLAQEPLQQPEASPWGAAILAGKETGDSEHVYGNSFGVEGTWQFLRDHWVQGRVRGSFIKIDRGRSSGEPNPYPYPLQGDFLVLSCDWIFRPMKGHGPYALLGAGANYHHVERYFGNGSDTTHGVLPSLAVGLGWLISNQVEVEVRQDAMMVDFIWGTRDAVCTSVVLRKRF